MTESVTANTDNKAFDITFDNGFTGTSGSSGTNGGKGKPVPKWYNHYYTTKRKKKKK